MELPEPDPTPPGKPHEHINADNFRQLTEFTDND